jgi:transcriptional regulator GlxA family with amidase domain
VPSSSTAAGPIPEALRRELHALADTVGSDDAAAILGVSPDTLARAIARRPLTRTMRLLLAVRVSRAWRLLGRELELVVAPVAPLSGRGPIA